MTDVNTTKLSRHMFIVPPSQAENIPVGLNAFFRLPRKVKRFGQEAGAGHVLRRGQIQRVYVARQSEVFDGGLGVLCFGCRARWRGIELT